jgi:hypothetical protein
MSDFVTISSLLFTENGFEDIGLTRVSGLDALVIFVYIVELGTRD